MTKAAQRCAAFSFAQAPDVVDANALIWQIFTMTHSLDEATAITRAADRLTAAAPGAYWNMAGPFGGATAALMMRAIIEDERRVGEPVAITVNFCGPIVDAPLELDVRVARSGKSVQHWSVDLRQGDTIVATATAVCALRREGWRFENGAMPEAPPPDALAPRQSDQLGWTSRYDMRFVSGAPRFERDDAGRDPRSVLWLRDAPARPLDFVSLTALSDAFFVRIVHARGDIPPVATVTLTTYFHATGAELARVGERALLGVADTRLFDHGFFDQTAELWSPDGHLIASSVQMVWFKG